MVVMQVSPACLHCVVCSSVAACKLQNNWDFDWVHLLVKHQVHGDWIEGVCFPLWYYGTVTCVVVRCLYLCCILCSLFGACFVVKG